MAELGHHIGLSDNPVVSHGKWPFLTERPCLRCQAHMALDTEQEATRSGIELQLTWPFISKFFRRLGPARSVPTPRGSGAVLPMHIAASQRLPGRRRPTKRRYGQLWRWPGSCRPDRKSVV